MVPKLHQYQIWKHPSGKIEATKNGWSWVAFFLNFIWAIYRGSWVLGVAVLLAFITLINTLGTNDIALEIVNYFVLATMIIFGIFGNILMEANLKAHGYQLETKVMGWNAEMAIVRFKKLYL
ncbi:MAG TPA: DUF2628 domain-containing protein [Methylophilaceae bacterium]|nr:DUF2628 domain-containing protein [Methylophilaceae bacterium]